MIVTGSQPGSVWLVRMDDLEHPFDHFPFLPGIDLTLWLQLVVVLAAALGALALGLHLT